MNSKKLDKKSLRAGVPACAQENTLGSDLQKTVREFGVFKQIDPELYSQFDIKRGLRNQDGSGVFAGITRVSEVHGYKRTKQGVLEPDEGKLFLRGYSISDFIASVTKEHRFGYEELVFLLLSGKLPSKNDLALFQNRIDFWRDLPNGFIATLIMNCPSTDAMNMLARSVLLLYAHDKNPDSTSTPHEIDVALQMISRLPRLAALSYLAHRQKQGKPMFINPPKAGLSTAETLLYMLRQNMEWTDDEAKTLDVMLMLQAEHGGGNNSTFNTRSLTSSGTDAYSAYAAGISSLKGPRHGGANIRVVQMVDNIKETLSNPTNTEALADYLVDVLAGEANDGSGLIYGMGHAVYTKSDPRAIICKQQARTLTCGTEFEQDFAILDAIEKLTPEVIARKNGTKKAICANIDLYSGLVYRTLGIPKSLYTPLFATARIAGWAAHRLEEIQTGKRIMRPAYKAISKKCDYVALQDRFEVVPADVREQIEHGSQDDEPIK